MEGAIGVVIAKADLIFFLNGKYFTIDNKVTAIKKWFDKHYKGKTKKLVVFEPTGGYERTLIEHMKDSSIPYKMIHANHIREFAKSKGVLLAKTDNIDAEMIANFACNMKLSSKSSARNCPKVKGILERREQPVNMRTQENNRLDIFTDKFIAKPLTDHIKHIDNEIQILDKSIKKLNETN